MNSLLNNKNSIAFLITALFALVAFADLSIWYVFHFEDHGNILTVAFLSIGQGDSILIQAPNGNTMIIDGGPANDTLSLLPKFLPFYERSIGMIMVTNPDKDHYFSFINLLKQYKVGDVIEPGTISPTKTYKQLEATIADTHTPKLIAKRGMRIMLDKKRGVFLTILFPDRDVSTLSTNDGSIVAKLTYGNTSVMLQGDSPSQVEKYLVDLDGAKLEAQILKNGHHGSRTSTSPIYVATVKPIWGIISAGFDNTYGFPHKETMATLAEYHVKPLITFKLGSIIMRSDGQRWSQSEIK